MANRKSISAAVLVQLVALVVVVVELANGAQVTVGIQSDMSAPTYGLHQPSSSHINYDTRNGMNVQGALSDLLGPPIKIAQGFQTMLNGGNMAGLGQSLKSGGAVMGVDAKLLEAAGGAKLLKGGILASGVAGKTGLAKTIAGLPGQKIASIVELPVKVIAMKDLVAGKTLVELGKSKANQAEQAEIRGEKMIQEGNQLKSQGVNQMMQGATQGIQNFGQHIQQTTGNAVTALKLLPIMLDMNHGSPQTQNTKTQAQQAVPQQQQQHQIVEQIRQEGEKAPQVQRLDQSHHSRQSQGGLTGGSLFGGLGNLFGGGNGASDPLAALSANNFGTDGQHRPNPFANLFGSSNQQNHYAAVLNATNPLTQLLMNPNLNPFLLPLNGAMDPMSNPLANSLSHPFGQQTTQQTEGSRGSNLFGNGFGFGFGGGNHNSQHGAGSQSSQFNLFPGLRFRETVSSGPQSTKQHQPQQHQFQEKTSQQVVEHQTVQQHLAEKSPPQQQLHQQQQIVEKSPPQQQLAEKSAPQKVVEQQQQKQQQDGTKKY